MQEIQEYSDVQYSKGLEFRYRKNHTMAIDYFEKAAEQGHADAQLSAGDYYMYGVDVPRDFKKALMYFEQAANQGYIKAYCNLGIYYMHTKDYPKAFQNFERATSGLDLIRMSQDPSIGNVTKTNKNQCIITEKGIWLFNQYESTLKTLQLLEAQPLSDFSSVLKLTENRLATKEDHKIIISSIGKTLASNRDAVALYHLGLCYEHGFGCTQSYGLAADYYRDAANLGNASAQYCLGLCYETGYGVGGKNIDSAKTYFQEAASQWHPDAKKKLESYKREELSHGQLASDADYLEHTEKEKKNLSNLKAIVDMKKFDTKQLGFFRWETPVYICQLRCDLQGYQNHENKSQLLDFTVLRVKKTLLDALKDTDWFCDFNIRNLYRSQYEIFYGKPYDNDMNWTLDNLPEFFSIKFRTD